MKLPRRQFLHLAAGAAARREHRVGARADARIRWSMRVARDHPCSKAVLGDDNAFLHGLGQQETHAPQQNRQRGLFRLPEMFQYSHPAIMNKTG